MRKTILAISVFITIIFCVAVVIGRNDDSSEELEYHTNYILEEEIVVEPTEEKVTNEDNSNIIIPSVEQSSVMISIAKNITSDQILFRCGYILSYNRDTKNPNWVAWHLTREHTDGPYSRKGVPYYADDGTVIGIGAVTPETCRNGYFMDMESEEPRQQLSDWTREYNMSHGHMCPAGDNKWDKGAMNQSFLLTNMCPQDEKLNQGGWKKLEEKCRAWANKYGGIYIVAGPIFDGAINRTIGEGRIAVPDAFYKVVLCLEGTPKGIGFIYINDSSSQSMYDNVYSIDDVEQITGIDFFPALPDEIEDEVERTTNMEEWK